MSVLVTSGATVPFEKLIRSTLSDGVLHQLAKQGYRQITVQYGSGKAIFDESVSSCHDPKLSIDGFDFTTDMAREIAKYDLVISHAGTGSILDALRANKKLIAVINTSLMDNHQAEIAHEFESQGYLVSTDTESISAALQRLDSTTLKQLPPADSLKLAAIINEEAGL
ncbi:N-acetylglucosaminyldiphosphodolichol N-acetylglucosaminyltransferase catalytic subunit ALG13 [Sugiyamaella lignohabitans]|uniref:UDP-N-acetylglucosamine transferase subunit ALG13 n=1 Tax=Sugiyamaella lignohabitans TaxID=796027 RepID=A0A161HGV0_9ASCO|nr:N-acetylglucosaminyldiphosphodolichol N-acetylglucosaminyltransferase catalytic subunit ALG13 [Sugiyamaella lignohabitans]ANB11117.1 N-acetylglucosaminyldiphosphodolichol N-acetylglucosaminyltransferase catalytic subunit ALG13 [Sugiyamaella lignohabitans]